MTPIDKPCRRVTRGALCAQFGPDRGRRLVASFEPGDLVTIRPAGTRRAETVSLFDVYRFAIRVRSNREHLEKARIAKDRKASRLAAARQYRAEQRLTKPI
jgi:hypothetical protein